MIRISRTFDCSIFVSFPRSILVARAAVFLRSLLIFLLMTEPIMSIIITTMPKERKLFPIKATVNILVCMEFPMALYRITSNLPNKIPASEISAESTSSTGVPIILFIILLFIMPLIILLFIMPLIITVSFPTSANSFPSAP